MKTIAQVWTLAVVGQQVWLYTDTKGKDVLEHHSVEFAREATWDKYKDCCLVAKSYLTLLWPHGL